MIVRITLLSLFCMCNFAMSADKKNDAYRQLLKENSEIIEKEVASLNLKLTEYTKFLQDKTKTEKEKAKVVKEMFATFMVGFPNEAEDLVKALSTMINSETTNRSTKKWILQIFNTMGTTASQADEAILKHLKNDKSYKSIALMALAKVSPDNAYFDEIMKKVIDNQDIPNERKAESALALLVSGRTDAKVLDIFLSMAHDRSDLPTPLLLEIAAQADNIPKDERKKFLEFIKKGTKKSYSLSIKNFFHEKMKSNSTEAMKHFAETLKIQTMESFFSFRYLSQLEESDLKLLAPVLIDLLKEKKQLKSIAYHLNDIL